MIFITYYFRASELPLFLEKVTEMMRTANKVLFASDRDVERFCEMLKKQLDESKPENSTAYIQVRKSFEEDSGVISVYLDARSDNSVLKLHYSVVRGVLEYDEHVGDYFDISERLEDIFKKGGTR